ncbi:MAG: ABC transporter ATP-binding protein [Spirochaetales bacterium]|nr:ABC transporter ATP-binding protein [Spirochaetales bacterium]
MLLELHNICKSYPSPAGGAGLAVLKKIDLSIEQEERVAVVGPSGSGKSTLLNIIGTLDRPDGGSLHFDGTDLLQFTENRTARFRNRDVGFVFQLHHLLPQCTVLENVLIPTLPEKKKNIQRALHLLKRVGLSTHIHHRPGELSGGERQRVALVRALINKPRLLLADEPTGSLDEVSSLELVKLLTTINKQEKTTMLVVTHSLELAKLMDRVVLLKNGRLEPFRGKL